MDIRKRQWTGVGVPWIAIAVLGIACSLAARPAWGADVNDVLARMRRAMEPGKDMRATAVLTVTNERGETVRWTGHLYRASLGLRLVFDDPIDLRGTEVSITRVGERATKTRVYLPALRRVRQLDADMRGESFLGTDFNYEDIGLGDLEYHQHRLEEEKDASCYRVESTPSGGWWYGRIERCIDKKDYLPRRTEYFDRNGVLWKVRTLGGVKKIGGYPTATEITMETVPQRTSTTITLSDIQYDTGLPEGLFRSP